MRKLDREHKRKKNGIKIKQSFKTGSFKKGSYSAGLIAIVIAIVFVVNLIVRQLPDNMTSIDLSDQKLYTIGSETRKIVKNINKDITIYQIAVAGNEDSYIQKLLERYESLSEYIHYEVLDPDLSPGVVSKYGAEDLDYNSLIVVSDDRYITIPYENIYETDYSSYYTTGYASYDFDGEGEVTSAIHYVTTDDLPVMYTLSGHNEQDLSDTIKESISKLNVELQTLSLVNSGIPEDCSILGIFAPGKDCTQTEAEQIIEYLKNGGKAIISMQYTGEDMPNFESVMEAYGVTFEDGYVIENDRQYYVESGYYLLPEIGDSEVTESIGNNEYVLIPIARGIKQMEDIRSTVEISSVLTTSSKSYSDVDYSADGKMTQSEEDIDGPFDVGVTIEDTVDDKNTKLLVLGSYYLFTDNITQSFSLANIDLLMNTITWMCGTEDTSVSIAAKSLDVKYNTIPAGTSSMYTGMFCVIIPLITVVGGLIVWFRRRRA